MIHRHISRTTPEELEQLKQEYDFTIAQIEGKVGDTNVTKGSQFFVKDNTPDKSVRSVMERVDFSNLSKHHIGAISLTKADIVEGYLLKL
jgi:cyanate lyase